MDRKHGGGGRGSDGLMAAAFHALDGSLLWREGH